MKQILLSGQAALVPDGGGAQGPGMKTALGKLQPCKGICCPSS